MKNVFFRVIYFAEIGEKYQISIEEYEFLRKELKKIEPKLRKRVGLDRTEKYALIWRKS